MATWTVLADQLATTGVHAAILPSGEVLYFSYDPVAENTLERSYWQLWHEVRGPKGTVPNIHDRNLFCAAHCWLGDGRLLVAAGQSNNWVSASWGADHDVHTFNVREQRWTRHADMPGARYYPTCVTLADGRGFIFGGAWKRVPQNYVNHEFEIFDWRTNKLSQPRTFNPGFIERLYPFAQLMTDGSSEGILWVHSGTKARLFDLNMATWLPPTFTAPAGHRTYPTQGAAVMLPLKPADNYRTRILLVGGADTTASHPPATDTAAIFEFDRNDPAASRYRPPDGGRQRHARFMSDATLLADGTVLVTGGSGRGEADHSHDPVLECELFDPVTETFSKDATLNNKRMYHSSAILLLSGRVAVSGHTEHWNPGAPVEDHTVELYEPDYLMRGPRPVVDDAPAAIAYGSTATLIVPQSAAVAQVALVRAGSVTHTNNMGQRWIGLTFTAPSATEIQAVIPRDRVLAPPGWYMVFVLNGVGVPSEGRMTFLDPTLQAPGRGVIKARSVIVPESSAGVDTGLDVRPGEEVSFSARGEIWAGVLATGNNGPSGWHNIDHDAKFPLNTGSNAHPFSLIGRYGNGAWFYIGDGFGPSAYSGNTTERLTLRTNDDRPGNGKGKFECDVEIIGDLPLGGVVIDRIERNPSGSDVAIDGGEYVELRNAGRAPTDLTGWSLEDLAGHQLTVSRPLVLPAQASVRLHTAAGTDRMGHFFFGRGAAVWNNDHDTAILYAPGHQEVARLSY